MSDTLSLARILAELKTLDARINVSLNAAFLGITQGSGEYKKAIAVTAPGKYVAVNSPTVEDVSKELTSNFQSTKDLISRKAKLKAALIQANATTLVKIGNDEITIAEAIERKASLPLKKSFLATLKAQSLNINSFLESEQKKLNTKIDDLIAKSFGTEKQADETTIKLARKSQEDQYALSIIDPQNISEHIKALSKEIEDFELNVDFALSEVNAQTKVEV